MNLLRDDQPHERFQYYKDHEHDDHDDRDDTEGEDDDHDEEDDRGEDPDDDSREICRCDACKGIDYAKPMYVKLLDAIGRGQYAGGMIQAALRVRYPHVASGT